MSYNGYHQVDEPFRMGTVKNNNPLNPFSSNTTNPKQWGNTPESLASTKDFLEMASFSLFFAGLWWCIVLVVCLVKHYLTAWLSAFTAVCLVASLLGPAALCFRRCEKWYEYGALEYWQPVKDLLRAGIRRKGLHSLASGILILLLTIVYGPFFVGTVAWVDELGQRAHRD